MSNPVDKNGNEVTVGAKVRIIQLSGQWFDDLPEDEKEEVTSMIGEVFVVKEIDEYGSPWVSKSWNNEELGHYNSHCIALDANEMELVAC